MGKVAVEAEAAQPSCGNCARGAPGAHTRAEVITALVSEIKLSEMSLVLVLVCLPWTDPGDWGYVGAEGCRGLSYGSGFGCSSQPSKNEYVKYVWQSGMLRS